MASGQLHILHDQIRCKDAEQYHQEYDGDPNPGIRLKRPDEELNVHFG